MPLSGIPNPQALNPPAGYKSSDIEIIHREDFSDVTYLLELRHPMMARAARPGQFVIVRVREGGERIISHSRSSYRA